MSIARCVALLVMVFLNTGSSNRAVASQEPDRTAGLEVAVDSLVEEVMDGWSAVPGAAVGVVDSGRVVLLEGYGVADVEAGEPVDPRRTLFHVASLSKPVTASALLQLAEEGRLDLHADVNGYLDDFRITSPYEDPVTTADLLTHTGGFDRRILGRMTRDPSELGDLSDYLAGRMPRVVREPGSLSVYSNHGFALAGYLLEAVTDTPFARAMKERIFEPLGMQRTSFALRPELERGLATGYGWRGANGPPVSRAYVRTVPASMLRTTAADLTLWMRAILAGGVLDSARILSPERSRQLLRRQRGNHPDLPGRSYGMSEGRRFEPPSVIHSGGVPGFTSALLMHEELRLGIVVLLNGQAPPWDIIRGILERYDGDVPSASPPPFLDDGVPTSHLAGYYRNAEVPHRGPARIGALVEQVRVRAPEPGRIVWGRQSYRAVDSLAFRLEGDDEIVAFVKAGGAVRYAARSGGEYERVSWLRTRPVQAGLWAGFLMVFLGGIVAGAARLVRRRKGRAQSPALPAESPPDPDWPTLIAAGAAALDLLFVALLAFGLSRVMGDAVLLDFGFPAWLSATFVLPLLAGLLVLPAAWGAIRSWREGWASPLRRLGRSILAAALLAFPLFLASWDLLRLPF